MATFPTIHLNGSSRQSLLDGYVAALDALRAAQEALQATGPNGRDYYPQGPGALRAAQDEHLARCQKIDAVFREVEAIAESIS